MDEREIGDALWSTPPRRAEAAPERERRAEKEEREREREKSCGVKGFLPSWLLLIEGGGLVFPVAL